jgi:acetolactate synthase I/III small subunit
MYFYIDQVHHSGLSPLLSSSLQRQSITELAKLFKAHIVDVSLESVVIELTAKPSRVDAFVELIKPFGILEAARSGIII